MVGFITTVMWGGQQTKSNHCYWKLSLGSWRNSSEVKSSGCFSSGHRFNFQASHGGWQASVVQFLRDPTPTSVLHGSCMIAWSAQTYMWTKTLKKKTQLNKSKRTKIFSLLNLQNPRGGFILCNGGSHRSTGVGRRQVGWETISHNLCCGFRQRRIK